MSGLPPGLALPPEARQAFVDLHSLVKGGSEPNREELAQHVALLRTAGKEQEFLDTALLETLAERHTALLTAAEALDPDQRLLALATVAYFLLTDDGDSDIDSVVGLEDDALVFNAVVAYLNLPLEPVPLP